MNRLHSLVIVGILSLGTGLEIGLAQEVAVDSAKTAVVQIRVNTAYDDSPDSLSLLQALATYAPVRSVTVKAGDTIAGLFVGEYGFGPSDLPKSYQLLVAAILAKNNLASAESLHPGPLVIPAVPKRVMMGFNRSKPLNLVANLTTFPADLAMDAASLANNNPKPATATPDLHPPDVAYKRIETVGIHRDFAQFETLAFSMPVGPAEELQEESKTFGKDGKDTVSGKDIVSIRELNLPVRLAQDNRCDTEDSSHDHPTLSTNQRATLTKVLTEQSKRSSVLFILDTGWPSASSEQESQAALHQIINLVWLKKFGAPFTPSTSGVKYVPASNQHCRCIERALQELRTLNSGPAAASHPIQVIYIPLTLEQGASTVLADLLQTSGLLQRLQSSKGALNQAIIDSTRKEAKKLVADRFPKQWTGNEVETDKSVLDAILLIGQAYAEILDTVFIVNESWTVYHDGKYYVQYQTPQFGMVTAAAGNDGTTKLLDFAQRSSNTSDTMAIFSATSNEIPNSYSTRPAPEVLGLSVVAGYDGYVTDDIFGTSFASPRIAWFLAAGEAVRKDPLDKNLWAKKLGIQIQNSHPGLTGYQSLVFDPVWYIEGQAHGVAASAPSNP